MCGAGPHSCPGPLLPTRVPLPRPPVATAAAKPQRRSPRAAPLQYAQWEEGQKDFRRARSVWERALDNDYRNTTVWLKVGLAAAAAPLCDRAARRPGRSASARPVLD